MIIKNNVITGVTQADVKTGTLILLSEATTIGANAFKGIKAKEVYVPMGITTIDPWAFAESEIENIILPESVVRVMDGAFSRSKLQRLVVKNRAVQLRTQQFTDCYDLRKITYGKGNPLQAMYWQGVLYVLREARRYDVYRVAKAIKIDEMGSAKATDYWFAFKDKAFGMAATLSRAVEICNANYVTPDLKEAYKNIDLNTMITAIDYRRITGACDDGVQAWLDSHNMNWETQMRLEDLLELLISDQKTDKTLTFGLKDFEQFILDRYHDRAIEKDKKDGTK